MRMIELFDDYSNAKECIDLAYKAGRKEGARNELELFLKWYDRAWTVEAVTKYMNKRLKELGA